MAQPVASQEINSLVRDSLVQPDNLEPLQKVVDSTELRFVAAAYNKLHLRDYADRQRGSLLDLCQNSDSLCRAARNIY